MAIVTTHEPGTFCWADLMAADLNKATEFYGNMFGWEAAEQDTHGGPPYVLFRLGGRDVAGGGQISAEMKACGVPPLWNTYVAVDDVDAALQKAEELGGKVAMPALDVSDAGRMAGIQDPTGGRLFLWQQRKHIGASRVREPGCVGWNELATRDAAGARDFYGRLFGWEFSDNPHAPAEYYVIRHAGAERGGIMQMTKEWGDMPPCWSVYFQVADVDGFTGQLQAAGGKLLVPPFDIPVGRLAVVTDPQGAAFYALQLTGG